jgi:predicted DNA-binding transcriptional regulator AlpA
MSFIHGDPQVLTEIPSAFVSAAEGAKLLGLSRTGFLKFVQSGLLPSPTRLGRRALWETSELVEALRQTRQASGDRR